MEINENYGSTFKHMKLNDNQRKSLSIIVKSIQVYANHGNALKSNDNICKSLKITEMLETCFKSLRIKKNNEHQRDSLQICANL